MSSFQNNLNEKVIPIVMKFVNLKGVLALKRWYLIYITSNVSGFNISVISAIAVSTIK